MPGGHFNVDFAGGFGGLPEGRALICGAGVVALQGGVGPGDLGIQLQGDVFEKTLSYTLGYYNGTSDGRDGGITDFDNRKEVAGRLFAEPFKNGGGALGTLNVLRNTGAALAPMNAFLLLQGLETLALRMERHTENALKVAHYLQNHPQVAWVKYAGLPDHPEHALAQRFCGGKPASILSFGIVGGQAAGARFIDALQLVVRLVNIGDAKSLACHPASTTHRQLNDEELERAGVPRDMVRLSIGIEHSDDILADLAQALDAAAG